MKLSVYTKAIVMIVITALTAVVSATSDDILTAGEVVNLAILLIGSIGTYWVPLLNSWWGSHTKTAIAILTAAGLLLNSYLTGDNGFASIGTGQWLQVILAALGAVGVGALDNVRPSSTTLVQNVGTFNLASMSAADAAGRVIAASKHLTGE